MGQLTGTNAAHETGGAGRTCRGCGSLVRAGTRFCTSCGLPVETGAGSPAPASGLRTRRARRLRVVAGVSAAAGLAGVTVLAAHTLGHGNAAAAGSATTPRGTLAVPVASASPAGSPSPAASSPGPSSPPASPATERQAATDLAALLGQSGNERQAVDAAFTDAGQCGPALSQDAQTFSAAASSHRQLLNELAQLPGASVLPATLRQDLTAAWQASASADSDYARWARDLLASGCTTGSQSDPGYTAASGPNQQATASKSAFVRLWNPLARSYGLPTYSQSDL